MSGREEHFVLCLSLRNHSTQIFLPLFLYLLLSFSSISPAVEAARPGYRWSTPLILGGCDPLVLTPVLVAGRGPGPKFAFGFFNRPKEGLLLSVFLMQTNNVTSVELVWTANRNNPLWGSAELALTDNGDLRLSDGRGNLVWSTNTSGKGVAFMNLTEGGNLVLVGATGGVVWQSYDHPTDTALRGQSLTGKTLVANASATNSSEGSYFLSITNSFYEAYVIPADPGSPNQMYYTSDLYPDKKLVGGILYPLPSSGIQRRNLAGTTAPNGSIINSSVIPNDRKNEAKGQPIPFDYAKGFLRLESDGRLQEYVWVDQFSLWEKTSWLDDKKIGDCGYPKFCGSYGLCTEGFCSCLDNGLFQPVDKKKPSQGCNLVNDLLPSCAAQAADPRQDLVVIDNISYFGYVRKADMQTVSTDSCKAKCATNCSCKAAFFKYGQNSSIGDCYLVSTVLSVTYNNWTISSHNSSVYIKVRIPDTQKNRRRTSAVILSISLIALVTLAVACILYRRRKNLIARAKRLEEEAEDELLPFLNLAGIPTKFRYEELKDATDGFSNKLGEGGFGAVFKGTLKDGTQVAVKILGYGGQGMKEFLAEVETIGRIHHLNLVKLVGYCAERLHRLLVYEYLSNGSLESWIFHDETKSKNRPRLDLDTKTKIILQVAKGLAYLHEECRNRIIHFDIKPQNILLDDNFNAKVSDFGLSKLVDRDQSQVMTVMRGTPGYIAPEWLNSIITEKVDVYSFGVVVLETVSGKKILDYSRSQGSINLVHLLSKAAAEERLADIIGAHNNDERTLMLVKIAMWCLHMDYTKRPSMSDVVKALEGVMAFEPPVDFWVPPSGPVLPLDMSSPSMSSPFFSSITEPR